MKHALTAALLISLFAGGAAMADPPEKHDDHHDNGHHESGPPSGANDNRHDDRDDHHDNRDEHHDRDDHRADARGRYHVTEYHRPRDYHEHKWRKGERLPTPYRSKVYVVEEYNSYRLRPPPRGYHWVRVNNDVVLAAIATGVVLEVVNDLFYQ